MKSDEISAAKSAPEEDLKTYTQHTLKRAKQFEKEVAALKLKLASMDFWHFCVEGAMKLTLELFDVHRHLTYLGKGT